MRVKLLLLFFLSVAIQVSAQTPLNDNCTSATTLTAGVTCVNTAGTVANATASAPAACIGTNDDDVWYKFTATTTAHKIQVTGSSGFDPVLQVFDGLCGANSLKCQDASSGTSETLLLRNLVVGRVYTFRVYHYAASVTTSPTFNVCVTTYNLPVIALTNQSNQSVCGGSTFSVPFTTTGTFEPGNIFKVELSDAAGAFGSPLVIGTGTASPVTATAPTTIPAGTGYRVRVRSTNYDTVSAASTYTVNMKIISIAVNSSNGTTFTATASGGVGPYQYSTNGTTYSSNNTFTGLSQGQNYTVYARDATNCSTSLVFRINSPVKCNVLTASGGQGTTFTPHTLGIAPGTVTVSYDLFSIPDQMDILYNGAVVASTNGLVSGANSLTFNYNPLPGGPFECIIKMYAPLNGTAWEYFAGCPESGAGNVITNTPVNTCNYQLKSPNYPANYANGTDISQTFTPVTAGKKLRLTFTSFQTESSDYVYLYNGPNTSSPLLGRFSGSSLPPSVASTTAGGELTVRFTSDNSVVYKGWQADITCEDPITATTVSNTNLTTCSQNIASPNFGTAYPANANITQTILPATAGKKVKLNFLAFNTESNTDLVKIYDGNSTAGTLLGTYSGTTLPPTALATTATGALTVVFTSNASVQNTGWLAEVSCSNAGTPLTATAVTTCERTVTSPNYPLNYASNTSITQTFTPSTTGSQLSLTFNTFDLENGYDFLEVYNGANTTSPLLGRLTGTTLPASVTSSNTAGKLTLKFTTDGSGVRKGFSADLKCIVPNPNAITTMPLTTCSSTVTSPAYPANYPGKLNITKVLTPATAGRFIRLNFTEFSTEPGFDYLRIYNGSSTSAPLLRTLSGRAAGTQVTASNPAGQLTLSFVTDSLTSAKGWSAAISCSITSGTADELFSVLTYYPNPANTSLNIKGENFAGKSCYLELVNLTGQTVYRQQERISDRSLKTEINTSGFAPGVYVLRISGGETVQSYKVVVQH